MTMFYSDRDLRLLEEKRIRQIVREEIADEATIRYLRGDRADETAKRLPD